jgi:hypothetical protein
VSCVLRGVIIVSMPVSTDLAADLNVVSFFGFRVFFTKCFRGVAEADGSFPTLCVDPRSSGMGDFGLTTPDCLTLVLNCELTDDFVLTYDCSSSR